MLDLSMVCQRPHLQVRVTFSTSEYLAKTAPEGFYLPHHPDSVGLCRVNPKRAACLENHDHRLGHIVMEDQAVKHINMGVKCLLKAGLPCRFNNTTICIKIRRRQLHIPAENLRVRRSLEQGTLECNCANEIFENLYA